MTFSTLALNVDDIRRLLLAMAQQRSVNDVLGLVVDRLASMDGIALARIWLAEPGDICADCRFRAECPDKTVCLHLVASAGQSIDAAASPWTKIDGDFRRFPFGVRKVGRIAATAEPVEVPNIEDDEGWIARPAWAATERIRGFGGQPLLYRGQVLGVLAVFARSPMSANCLVWIRTVADHAAAAIANARAFERIEHLTAQLEQENDYLREEIRDTQGPGDIIGASPALAKTLSQVDLIAPADAPVLVCGESGTGKELIARAIHERSGRRDRPMVKVNCASIPHDLFESEFFGHVKGAFTGAVRDRIGRFQLADHGTLFLDEIGEIPLELQSKLLRVLQEGTFERVGEESTRRVDARIVAATNRDLEREVAEGRFREDLYYRLSVFALNVAPLRQRPEDVPLLAAHFIGSACRRLNRPEPKLKKRHVEELTAYGWPGNVRELQSVIERAVLLSAAGSLVLDLKREARAPVTAAASTHTAVLSYSELKSLERANILRALEQCRWRVSGPHGAAALLKLKPTTLASKIKSLGLSGPQA